MISQIGLPESRKTKIKSCFKTDVEFHYPNCVNELDEIPSTIKKKKSSNKDDDYNKQEAENTISGEKGSIDKLIVMCNISGIADK